MLELENSMKQHNTFTLLSDTFCASHQQAGEGEADKMVYSISTETEIQGMSMSMQAGLHCSLSLFWLEPILHCMHPMVCKDSTTCICFHSKGNQRNKFTRTDERPEAVQFCWLARLQSCVQEVWNPFEWLLWKLHSWQLVTRWMWGAWKYFSCES